MSLCKQQTQTLASLSRQEEESAAADAAIVVVVWDALVRVVLFISWEEMQVHALGAALFAIHLSMRVLGEEA